MEMINVKVDEVNGVLVTTSNRVAEELGVRHDNLLDKIDEYLNRFNSPELSGQFYIPCFYRAKNGRKVRNYLITKKGIAQLIGGYSSAVERAFELNVAYINKFDEMEKIINSGKQLSIEYPAKKDLEVRTFRNCQIMEIRQLCQLTGFSRESIAFNARLLKATVLKHRELMEYKNENGENLRRVANLVILYKNQVIKVCQVMGCYEEVKDIIENYFKVDNKIPYKKEEVKVERKNRHTIQELELILKASDLLNEKYQKEYVAEYIIEEIMGNDFFNNYYISKTAVITKAHIQELNPEQRKILQKKIETNKMYGQLGTKAKNMVDCILGKEV